MDLCFECGKLVDEYYHKSKAICKSCYSQRYFPIKYPITILQYPYIIGNFLRTPPSYIIIKKLMNLYTITIHIIHIIVIIIYL